MTFPLRIFSIDRELFVGPAKSITLPSVQGEIQILPNHEPLISLLQEGNMVIESQEGADQTIPIAGGVVEIKPTETVVLVNF